MYSVKSAYLDMEIKITHITEQLDELRQMLVHSADDMISKTCTSHATMEESIAYIQQLKSELCKLDLSPCHELELRIG